MIGQDSLSIFSKPIRARLWQIAFRGKLFASPSPTPTTVLGLLFDPENPLASTPFPSLLSTIGRMLLRFTSTLRLLETIPQCLKISSASHALGLAWKPRSKRIASPCVKPSLPRLVPSTFFKLKRHSSPLRFPSLCKRGPNPFGIQLPISLHAMQTVAFNGQFWQRPNFTLIHFRSAISGGTRGRKPARGKKCHRSIPK